MTNKYLIVLLLILLSSCSNKFGKTIEVDNNSLFTKINFADTDYWGSDKKIEEAIPTFAKSCKIFLNRDDSYVITKVPIVTTAADWKPICNKVVNDDIKNVKEFFENNFDIYLIRSKHTGFITGYYHIFIKGSRNKTGVYKYPIYGVPNDLVRINVGNFELSERATSRIIGRIVNNEFVPYHSAYEIDKMNALEGKAKIIAYVASRLERFLLHVQGSGTILFDDGTEMKLDYAAQNGLSYKGLSKALVELGFIERGNVNLETMMQAYKEYPNEVSEIILENKSYIFLKESDTSEVIGGMGVGLTPERSVAIDLKYLAYGVPLWLELTNYQGKDINKVVIAQDRGGAIIGPNRLDYYWGKGDQAGIFAGNTKHNASVYLLLPKVSQK